jgi:hypothetical protein
VHGAAIQSDASDGSVDDGPADAADTACLESGISDSGAPIPLGVYASCSSAVVEANSLATGAGGSLTVTETNGALTVEVGKKVFAVASGTLGFAPITGSNAVAAPGQTYGIYNVNCATSSITAGALALAGDKLLVSLIGAGCNDPISGTVSCAVPTEPMGSLVPPNPCPSAKPSDCTCVPPAAFAVGVYGKCTPSIEAFGGGEVTVAQNAGMLSATIDGVTSVAPAKASLLFAPTSSRTATIAPGQSWTVYVPGVAGPLVPAMMMVTSGSLVIDGSTLFAFVRGTEDSGIAIEKVFHCVTAR